MDGGVLERLRHPRDPLGCSMTLKNLLSFYEAPDSTTLEEASRTI